jgi:hypothetical protein
MLNSEWSLEVLARAEGGAVPKVEAGEQGGEAGDDERSCRGAVAAEVVGVAGGHEGAEREVGAIGDEAEAGEGAGGLSEAGPGAGDDEEQDQGQQATPEWAAPGYELGVWIGGDVGAGEVEQGEGDAGDVAAGEQGVEREERAGAGHRGGIVASRVSA